MASGSKYETAVAPPPTRTVPASSRESARTSAFARSKRSTSTVPSATKSLPASVRTTPRP